MSWKSRGDLAGGVVLAVAQVHLDLAGGAAGGADDALAVLLESSSRSIRGCLKNPSRHAPVESRNRLCMPSVVSESSVMWV